MKVLVMGGDVADDGANLGHRSLARVSSAVNLARDGGVELLFMATYSPTYKSMKKPFGEMMASEVWKTKLDIPATYVSGAKSFDSVGEVEAFLRTQVGVDESFGVVSGRYHLPRLWFLIARKRGVRYASMSVLYFSAPGDRSTWKLYLLESMKWVHLFLPKPWQRSAQNLYRIVFGERLI